jgi:hypothetical protein
MVDSPTETPNNATPDIIEKLEQENRDEDDDTTYEPITSEARNQRQAVRRTSSHGSGLDRCWSLNDGYSTGAADEEEGKENNRNGSEEQPQNGNSAAAAASASESEILVAWEESDPMNPRNLSLMRRWLIVIIVSMGSICV